MANEAIIVPGLNAPLGPRDYAESRLAYNDLPNDSLTSQRAYEHTGALFRIADESNLLEHFGFHLVHIHGGDLDVGTVKFGVDGKAPVYRKAKPTRINALSDKSTHGHIFVVTPDSSLRAYEFQEGDAPVLPPSDLHHFLRTFINYVQQNRLENVVGLQFYPKGVDRREMWEVVDGEENCMIDGAVARQAGYARGQTTGWVGFKNRDGCIQVSGNMAHIVQTDGKLYCYQDKKGFEV